MNYVNALDTKQKNAVDNCINYILNALSAPEKLDSADPNHFRKDEVRVSISNTYSQDKDLPIFFFNHHLGLKIPCVSSYIVAHYIMVALRNNGFFVNLKTKKQYSSGPALVISTNPLKLTDIGGPTHCI